MLTSIRDAARHTGRAGAATLEVREDDAKGSDSTQCGLRLLSSAAQKPDPRCNSARTEKFHSLWLNPVCGSDLCASRTVWRSV